MASSLAWRVRIKVGPQFCATLATLAFLWKEDDLRGLCFWVSVKLYEDSSSMPKGFFFCGWKGGLHFVGEAKIPAPHPDKILTRFCWAAAQLGNFRERSSSSTAYAILINFRAYIHGIYYRTPWISEKTNIGEIKKQHCNYLRVSPRQFLLASQSSRLTRRWSNLVLMIVTTRRVDLEGRSPVGGGLPNWQGPKCRELTWNLGSSYVWLYTIYYIWNMTWGTLRLSEIS